MTSKEVLGVYGELRGVHTSLANANSCFDDKGFSAHANEVIDRVGKVCPEIENINSYKIIPDHSPQRGPIIRTTQAKQKLLSLIGRIGGQYDLEERNENPGHTFIQNQSQSQTQYLMNQVLEMQERVLAEIPKHPVGSKERSFLEKLKQSLPTVKTVTDILSSALKIGGEIGLDPATIHKLLGL